MSTAFTINLDFRSEQMYRLLDNEKKVKSFGGILRNINAHNQIQMKAFP